MAPNPNAYPTMSAAAVDIFSEQAKRLEIMFPGIRLTLRFQNEGFLSPSLCQISLTYYNFSQAIALSVTDANFVGEAIERLEQNFKRELIRYGLAAMKVMSEIPAP